jgi:hypothetical protein
MPLVLSGQTSGSTTIQATDAVTATLTLPSTTGTLLSTANPQSGGVIQVVTSTISSQVSTTSNTYVSTGLSASITPKFATSKVFIVMSGQMYSSASAQGCITIYKNGSNLVNSSGFSNQYANGVASAGSACFMYLDSPATTSSTTYTVYMLNSNNSASILFNSGGTGNNQIASITLMEIAA